MITVMSYPLPMSAILFRNVSGIRFLRALANGLIAHRRLFQQASCRAYIQLMDNLWSQGGGGGKLFAAKYSATSSTRQCATGVDFEFVVWCNIRKIQALLVGFRDTVCAQ